MDSIGLVIIFTIIYSSNAWIVKIDSYTEECFYEKVKENEKLGLTFMVTDGGFLDIDVSMKDPDGRLLHETVRETSGKYTIVANMFGMYEICFSSKESSQTPKEVMFDVLTSVTEKEWEFETEKIPKEGASLHSMVTELVTSLRQVQKEQSYIGKRNLVHLSINERTNVVVARWSVFEAFLVVIGSAFEIWYIKRFFEVRWKL